MRGILCRLAGDIPGQSALMSLVPVIPDQFALEGGKLVKLDLGHFVQEAEVGAPSFVAGNHLGVESLHGVTSFHGNRLIEVDLNIYAQVDTLPLHPSIVTTSFQVTPGCHLWARNQFFGR